MDTPQTPQGYQPPTDTAAQPLPQAQPTTPQAPPPTTAQPAAPIFTPQPAAPLPSFLAPQQPAAPAVHDSNRAVSTYHDNVGTSGFDDDVKTGDYDSYKGQKGRTDRIGFLRPRDLKWARTHFIEVNGSKGFHICDSKFQKQGGQEVPVHLAACCQKFGPPKKRFSTLVAQYNTDQTGRVLMPFSYTLKVWRLNEILFDQIRTLNREHPLEHCDIWAKCTDDQFWKYEITPLRDCIVSNADFRNSPEPGGSGMTNGQVVDAYVAAMTPRLERTLGKVNDAQEWAQLLGGAGGFAGPAFGGTPQPGESPVTSIAQLLGGAK